MSIIWDVDMNYPGATILYNVIYYLCYNLFFIVILTLFLASTLNKEIINNAKHVKKLLHF